MRKIGTRGEPLNVRRVLQEFQEAESKKTHRKGTFKIDKPFEEALHTILSTKTKPSGSPRKLQKNRR